VKVGSSAKRWEGAGLLLGSIFSCTLSCGPAPRADLACTEEAIYGGSVDLVSYSAALPHELGGIGRLATSGTAGELTDVCTATLVKDQVILTAGHCARRQAPQTFTSGAGQRAAVLSEYPHDRLDLAVMFIEPVAADPLPIVRHVDDAMLGAWAEIVGHGLDETGRVGIARSVVVEVVAIGALIETRAVGPDAGGCYGDSGGPLLSRDRTGHLSVLGSLSRGSANCREADLFERLDVAMEWLETVAGQMPSFSDVRAPCGALGRTGRCFEGSAMWCDEGTLQVKSMEGFRCGDPENDPCGGHRDIADCVGNQRTWCDRGRIQSEACGCEKTCILQPATGAATCG
jgi:hypothetical protein